MTDPIALRSAAAAELLDVSERTLEEWTAKGIVPSFKIGGTRRYSVRALAEWAYMAALREENDGQATDPVSAPVRPVESRRPERPRKPRASRPRVPLGLISGGGQ